MLGEVGHYKPHAGQGEQQECWPDESNTIVKFLLRSKNKNRTKINFSSQNSLSQVLVIK